GRGNAKPGIHLHQIIIEREIEGFYGAFRRNPSDVSLCVNVTFAICVRCCVLKAPIGLKLNFFSFCFAKEIGQIKLLERIKLRVDRNNRVRLFLDSFRKNSFFIYLNKTPTCLTMIKPVLDDPVNRGLACVITLYNNSWYLW